MLEEKSSTIYLKEYIFDIYLIYLITGKTVLQECKIQIQTSTHPSQQLTEILNRKFTGLGEICISDHNGMKTEITNKEKMEKHKHTEGKQRMG